MLLHLILAQHKRDLKSPALKPRPPSASHFVSRPGEALGLNSDIFGVTVLLTGPFALNDGEFFTVQEGWASHDVSVALLLVFLFAAFSLIKLHRHVRHAADRLTLTLSPSPSWRSARSTYPVASRVMCLVLAIDFVISVRVCLLQERFDGREADSLPTGPPWL